MTMDSQPENLQGAPVESHQEELMERPDDDAPEHEKCKWWRTEVVSLSREQLAPLIGFSAAAIKDFERTNKAVDPMARKRYMMACAALSIGVNFNWLETSLLISRPVEITMKMEAKRK
jgi:hypothetical protein